MIWSFDLHNHHKTLNRITNTKKGTRTKEEKTSYKNASLRGGKPRDATLRSQTGHGGMEAENRAHDGQGSWITKMHQAKGGEGGLRGTLGEYHI